ncbi:MAG TPA: hypothetical protein VIG82_11195 [Enteractinococcus sp.]
MKHTRILAILSIATLSLVGCATDEPDQTQPDNATETATTEVTDTETAEQPSDLGPELEATLLESNGVESFRELEPTSPGYYISDIEGISDGTARVYMQTELSEDEADTAARWVFNMGCSNVDFHTVVIRDTSGIDQNFFADSMEPLLCD